MTLTLNLSPELEQFLLQEAKQHGLSVEALAVQLLTRSILQQQGESVNVLSVSQELRPFGLCAGEFTVPDDFDAPLPEEILKDFEGK